MYLKLFISVFYFHCNNLINTTSIVKMYYIRSELKSYDEAMMKAN